MKITYNKKLPQTISNNFLEEYYEEFILPQFNLEGSPKWKRHTHTGPDNSLHTFSIGSVRYALAFDDYPSGFSVDGESFVHAMRCKNGDNTLYVEVKDDKYIEGLTGYFMLFQVADDKAFDTQMDYLELAYKHIQEEWEGDSKQLVSVTRDMLQLAETAVANKDWQSLHSISNLIDAFDTLDALNNDATFSDLKEYVRTLDDTELGYTVDEDARKRARANVYSQLSKETQYHITASRYAAQNLGTTVTLVTAMYAEKTTDMTSGTSVFIVIDNGVFVYPLNHFLDDELKNYFRKHPEVNKANIKSLMPHQLGKYTLVEGLTEVRQLFRRELDYIAW